jgi:hypothetical protein
MKNIKNLLWEYNVKIIRIRKKFKIWEEDYINKIIWLIDYKEIYKKLIKNVWNMVCMLLNWD